MKGYTSHVTSALAANLRDPDYVATLPPNSGRRTLRGRRMKPTLWDAPLPCDCTGPYSVCEDTVGHDTKVRLGLMAAPMTKAQREKKALDELRKLREELAAASWRK